jgi:hypothetical protein
LKTLSFKTKKLLDKLGGVESAILYLEKNGDFTQIPGIGRATDHQLQAYLNQLATLGLESSSQKVLRENDPIIAKVIMHYEALKEYCSVRTSNILNQLEESFYYNRSLSNKVLFLNTYFFRPFDFLNIRNAGKKTVTELYNLSKSLKEHYEKKNLPTDEANSNSNINIRDTAQVQFFELKQIDFRTLQEYQFLKRKCSVRTRNILRLIEVNSNFGESIENQIFFLKKYFLSNFDYSKLENAGTKTVNELKEIRKSLASLVVKDLNEKNGNDEIRGNKINFFLTTYLGQLDFNELKVENYYSLQKVFRVLIEHNNLTKKVKQVLFEYLISHNEINYQNIASQANCSIETVRKSSKHVADYLIPSIVESLKSFSNDLKIESLQTDRSNIFLEIQHFDNFWFNSELFKTNSIFSHYLLPRYLEPDHIYINQLSPLVEGKSAVFDCKDYFYFVSKEFSEKINFPALLEFLNDEIYNFESSMFDYNLKILIGRYFSENELPIEKNSLELVFNFILKIKREIVEVIPSRIGKVQRNKNKEDIKRIVEEFLGKSNQAKKTKEIIAELQSNNIEIEPTKLLHHLNKWTHIFSRVGNGAWGLTEWLTSKKMKGSIREIVEKLLIESERPLHISEILSFFQKFRPMVETSLVANIKVSENINFIIFNCSFIGLKGKDYDSSWLSIPRFLPSDLMSVINTKSLSLNERIATLEKKGYPRIHCEYLIRKNLKALGEGLI